MSQMDEYNEFVNTNPLVDSFLPCELSNLSKPVSVLFEYTTVISTGNKHGEFASGPTTATTITTNNDDKCNSKLTTPANDGIHSGGGGGMSMVAADKIDSHIVLKRCKEKRGSYFTCITYKTSVLNCKLRHICDIFPVMIGSNLDADICNLISKSITATQMQQHPHHHHHRRLKQPENAKTLTTPIGGAAVGNDAQCCNRGAADYASAISDATNFFSDLGGMIFIDGTLAYMPFLLTNRKELGHKVKRSNGLFCLFVYDIENRGHMLSIDANNAFIYRNENGIESNEIPVSPALWPETMPTRASQSSQPPPKQFQPQNRIGTVVGPGLAEMAIETTLPTASKQQSNSNRPKPAVLPGISAPKFQIDERHLNHTAIKHAFSLLYKHPIGIDSLENKLTLSPVNILYLMLNMARRYPIAAKDYIIRGEMEKFASTKINYNDINEVSSLSSSRLPTIAATEKVTTAAASQRRSPPTKLRNSVTQQHQCAVADAGTSAIGVIDRNAIGKMSNNQRTINEKNDGRRSATAANAKNYFYASGKDDLSETCRKRKWNGSFNYRKVQPNQILRNVATANGGNTSTGRANTIANSMERIIVRPIPKNISKASIPTNTEYFLCLAEKSIAIDSPNRWLQLLPNVVVCNLGHTRTYTLDRLLDDAFVNAYIQLSGYSSKLPSRLEAGACSSQNHGHRDTMRANECLILVNGGLATHYALTNADDFDSFLLFVKQKNQFIEVFKTDDFVMLNLTHGVPFIPFEFRATTANPPPGTSTMRRHTIMISPLELNTRFADRKHSLDNMLFGPNCQPESIEMAQYATLTKMMVAVNYFKNRFTSINAAPYFEYTTENVCVYFIGDDSDDYNDANRINNINSISSKPGGYDSKSMKKRCNFGANDSLMTYRMLFSSHPQITADSYILDRQINCKCVIYQRSRFDLDIQPNLNIFFISHNSTNAHFNGNNNNNNRSSYNSSGGSDSNNSMGSSSSSSNFGGDTNHWVADYDAWGNVTRKYICLAYIQKIGSAPLKYQIFPQTKLFLIPITSSSGTGKRLNSYCYALYRYFDEQHHLNDANRQEMAFYAVRNGDNKNKKKIFFDIVFKTYTDFYDGFKLSDQCSQKGLVARQNIDRYHCCSQAATVVNTAMGEENCNSDNNNNNNNNININSNDNNNSSHHPTMSATQCRHAEQINGSSGSNNNFHQPAVLKHTTGPELIASVYSIIGRGPLIQLKSLARNRLPFITHTPMSKPSPTKINNTNMPISSPTKPTIPVTNIIIGAANTCTPDDGVTTAIQLNKGTATAVTAAHNNIDNIASNNNIIGRISQSPKVPASLGMVASSTSLAKEQLANNTSSNHTRFRERPRNILYGSYKFAALRNITATMKSISPLKIDMYSSKILSTNGLQRTLYSLQQQAFSMHTAWAASASAMSSVSSELQALTRPNTPQYATARYVPSTAKETAAACTVTGDDATSTTAGAKFMRSKPGQFLPTQTRIAMGILDNLKIGIEYGDEFGTKIRPCNLSKRHSTDCPLAQQQTTTANKTSNNNNNNNNNQTTTPEPSTKRSKRKL